MIENYYRGMNELQNSAVAQTLFDCLDNDSVKKNKNQESINKILKMISENCRGEETTNSQYIDIEVEKSAPAYTQVDQNVQSQRKRSRSKKPSNSGKPLNPYVRFYNENKQRVKEENPNFTTQELSKHIGEMWRTMPDKDKQVYKDKYAKEKAEYDEKNKENFTKILSKEAYELLSGGGEDVTNALKYSDCEENPPNLAQKKREQKNMDKWNDLFDKLVVKANSSADRDLFVMKNLEEHESNQPEPTYVDWEDNAE